MAGVTLIGALSLAALVLAVLGLVLGRKVAEFAAHRSVDQPVSVNLRAESDVLGVVLDDLGRYPQISVLEASDFALPAHQRIWEQLQHILGEDARTEDEAAVPAIARRLRREQGAFLALVEAALSPEDRAVLTSLRARPLEAFDPTLMDQARDVTADADTTEEELAVRPGRPELARFAVEESGGYVLDAHEGRTRYQGSSALVVSDDPEKPLVRPLRTPSRTRVLATTLILAAGSALAPWLAQSRLDALPAIILGTLAIVVLVYMCVVASLVDIDTLYLDLPAMIFGGGAATLLAWAAAAADGNPRWILNSIIMVVGTAVAFELINFIYTKVRKRTGLGRGDTYLSVATVGVPVALTGSFLIGYYGIMAGMFVGMGIFIVGASMKKLTRDTPFAFGPGLAAGWILGWAAVVLGFSA